MGLSGAMRFCAVALMWGSSYFWIRTVLGGLSTTQFSVVRVTIGAVAMLGLLLVTRSALPHRRATWLRLVLIAFLTNALPVLLVEIVPDATGADMGVVSVFNASVPLWVLLLSLAAPDLRGGGPAPASVLIGFAGVLLMFPPWQAADRWLTWGSLVNLVAAIAYGYAVIYMWRVMAAEGLSPLVLSATQALLGVAWTALTLTWNDWGAAPHWSAKAVVALLILGVLNTAVVFTFFVRLIRDDGPLMASTVLYLVPVVLVSGTVWLEDAHLTWAEVLGMILAAVGVTAALRSRRSSGAATPPSERYANAVAG